MRTVIVAIMASALVPALAVAEGIAPEQFIREAIQAHGGDKSERFPAEVVKMEGKFVREGKLLDFTSEFSLQLPNQYRRVIRFNVDDRTYETIAVFNGERGWLKRDENTEEMGRLELIQARDVVYSLLLARLAVIPKDPAFRLTYLPGNQSPTVVNRYRSWGIHVSHQGEKDAVLWISEEKRLLMKLERELQISETKTVKLEEFFDDYREVNGIPRAFRRDTLIDGKKIGESKTTEIKLYDRLDEKLFAKP